MRQIKVLLTVAFILLAPIFIMDGKLYFYGQNVFNIGPAIYDSLPLRLKPDFWGHDLGLLGFILEDEYGFVVLSKDSESKYRNQKINVEVITRYGFNDKELIALIKDVNDRKYYIEFSKNNKTEKKQDMVINVLDGNHVLEYKNYKWIDIDGSVQYVERMNLFRNYLIIAFVMILVLVFLIKANRTI